ncbi:efflux RND transporter periplasmic adaptor subunit [Desulfoluna spongiiphila]|uniref:Membrane fusion protein, multidrug efflux system n=1 Tax=Desulfoluna spongiiphila TaxID=419481 RepID=A0A1G5DDE5_9BACT|nr:efflux RND transporter periplasmic adaptor subunit [Desulfoluna spongiiphila]SCY12577.1 membrane fusion protein, multidrug efflux system [Desulfoluna spongiiphila]VVS95204.1 rnd efflux pump membrane fusion protein [Desulfoluna spongiiphila]
MTFRPPHPSLAKKVITACAAWWPVCLLMVVLLILYVMTVMKAEAVAKARRDQRKEGSPPVNVVTLTLAPTTIRDRVTLPGEVRANQELLVPSEVSAVLINKTRQEGEAVKAGDTLAQLDTSRFAARLQAATASFESAQATARRLTNLNRTNLATRSDLDQAEAALEEARSVLTVTRLDLAKCQVKAPFAGYLDAYLIDKGAFVTAGSPICRLVDLNPVKIRVGIPESDVRHIRTMASFSVSIDALGGDPIQGGRVLHLARSAGNKARLYDLDLLFPNDQGHLIPDMFARVDLIKEVREQALAIPLYALITRKNTQVVFLEEKGLATAREVTTGIQEGWMVEVTRGLAPGDKVIVVGQRSVSEGRKVNVVRRVQKAEELQP